MNMDLLDMNNMYSHVERNRQNHHHHHGMHRNRLDLVERTFKTENPTHAHLASQLEHNRGHNPIRDEELIEVQKTNRRLVESLATITYKPGRFKKLVKPGDPAIEPHHFGTLNSYNRRSNGRRIERENQKLAHRIDRSRGMIDTPVFERDFQHHKQLMTRLSRAKHLKGLGSPRRRMHTAPHGMHGISRGTAAAAGRTPRDRIARVQANFARLGLGQGPRSTIKKGMGEMGQREAGQNMYSEYSVPYPRYAMKENQLYKHALSSLEQELSVMPMHLTKGGEYQNPTQAQMDHREAVLSRQEHVEQRHRDYQQYQRSQDQMSHTSASPRVPHPPATPRPQSSVS
jgi:hypothetical protein